MTKQYGWIVPVVLGVGAAGFYFAAVKSAVRPIDLVSVARDTKAGTDLGDDNLARVSVRADPKLLKSAVKWDDRGILLGRRVNRPLGAGELVLFADVRQAGSDVRANLQPGEVSVTLTVPASRIVPGLRVADPVMVLVLGDQPGVPSDGSESPAGRPGPGSGRLVGPFRVVGFGDRTDPFASGTGGREEHRQVVVAIKIDAKTGNPADPAGRELEEAARGARGERVLAVESPPTRVR